MAFFALICLRRHCARIYTLFVLLPDAAGDEYADVADTRLILITEVIQTGPLRPQPDVTRATELLSNAMKLTSG